MSFWGVFFVGCFLLALLSIYHQIKIYLYDNYLTLYRIVYHAMPVVVLYQ